VHLTDRAFAGADTLATARALALACQREGYDLILCGRHSTDAETGQVGPEIAELLDIPQVTGVAALTLGADGKTLRVERETDSGFDTLDCPLPALVSATEDLAPERFPRKAERQAAQDKPVETVTAGDLSADLTRFGAAGSPTWVESVQTVEDRESRVLEGELSEQIDSLVQTLLARGLFGTWADEGTAGEKKARSAAPEPGKAVWVVAETLGDTLRPVSLELLGKAVELSAQYGGEVGAVLIGGGLDGHIAPLAEYGADVVYRADDARLTCYDTDLYAALLSRAIQTHTPQVLLLGSTAIGRDLAPRVAARLGLGLTGDCVDLEVDNQGRLLQLKPAFGGNIVAPILSKTTPAMATVRPGMLSPSQSVAGRQARVERLTLDDDVHSRVQLVSQTGADAAKAAALDAADIAIGVGKGIGGPENLPVIEQLAEVLGGAPLASTRDISDLGWLPRQHQVGITGRAIAPKLYFAIGIRGAFEHMVGLRKAGTIVAINIKAKAPIFKTADLGIVGDYAEVVPLLTEALRKARAER
jgi:electron transfer flavoprotein alpha subunit